MKKELKMVYTYMWQCSSCNMMKQIYYTGADFGDAPYIMHCKHCGELYWYTLEDEEYLRPIGLQIEEIKCETCKADLKNALVPIHKNIQCCGMEISLDDDFAGYNIPPVNDMVPVEVYLIYS